MKHLFSFVATLTVTVALSLMFAIPTTAVTNATTATATCTGTNADGTTATWTLGGSISYTTDYANDIYFPTYLNYRENTNGYNVPCSFTLTTSSDIKPNCAGLSATFFIHYVNQQGYGGTQNVGSFASGETLAPNHSYGEGGFGFPDLLIVKNVQYKVTSIQAGSTTTWEVATSYL